ncbi:hypothetical protein N7E70_015960 [Aminobacter sp. NyZ550]|uniref:hypothetical protein n=1 Tax=Aminobacter sp. NyZ550 TaxID=2979870 RepID=UPI0021D5B458|nr:hypothetical protein [Aminobacter sp. NyZ550]WAX93193.1 hypothetical protein N7E70_015960 [Aminobacter sp. NyZ550]
MNSVTVHFAVRVSWWVKPYLIAASLYVRAVSPFLDVDDDRLDGFVEQQAEFVRRNGIRVICDGKRI